MSALLSPPESNTSAPAARRPGVLLLTSHAVAPPWDGGDKNMARLLLEGAADVDYAYVGTRTNGSSWPQSHTTSGIDFRHAVPSGRDKLQLLRWLILHPPEVEAVHLVVTFQSPRIQYALLALPLLRRRPLIVTCLSRTHLPRRLIARSAAVVAISAHTEQLLRDSGFDNVHRITPGVDLDWFRPDRQHQRECPKDTPDCRLLFAGHYDQGGGLDAALNFVARLRTRVPAAKLVVAMRRRHGETRKWARADLRRRALEAGVPDAVEDLGMLSDIRPVLRSCRAVLFQPDVLGLKMELPMTLLEALASGRPIVISPIPPLTELGDGSSAVTVAPPGDDSALAHVESLLTNPGAAERASRSARALAEREFSACRMVADYRELYRSLIR